MLQIFTSAGCCKVDVLFIELVYFQAMKPIARDPIYRRHRYPADVIAQAVLFYYRFPLSLRMVEDLLAMRGITVSHQTIRSWAEKFGRIYAYQLRRKSHGRFCDKWHLDEMCGFYQWKEAMVMAGG